MKNPKPDLVIVAHPDDETLFFAGLIQHYSQRPWQVICVTDGNADGFGKKRKRQFFSACKALGVTEPIWLGHKDLFHQRIEVNRLMEQLNSLPKPRRVFTHNILGEYGHPHHQDVCMAVHEVFFESNTVFSTAYNTYPDLVVKLSHSEYALKFHILAKIYSSETSRFINFLPTTWSEGFVKASAKEVCAIYKFLISGKRPPLKDLEVFKWYWPFLRVQTLDKAQRPF